MWSIVHKLPSVDAPMTPVATVVRAAVAGGDGRVDAGTGPHLQVAAAVVHLGGPVALACTG